MPRAFALVLLVACGASETRTAAVEVQATNDAPPAVDMSWIGGGDALVELMIRPHRWPEVRDAARALTGERAMPRDIEDLLATATFQDAVRLVFDDRFGTLNGLDPERPVMARLFEPAQPISFAQVMQAAQGNTQTALVHHWVVIPATDTAVLAASIREGLSRRCERNGDAMRCRSHDLHLLTADDWVVVAIDTDQLPERSANNDASWALGHPAAMHVQFEKMRQIGPYVGATRVDAALSAASDEVQNTMRAVATSELLVAHLHLRPELEELDSAVVALSTEPFGFIGAARMTERGAAIPFQRGAPTAASEAALVIRTGFDLEAARSNFPTFDTGVEYDTPQDLIHRIQECGFFCFAHGVSLPFTSARMAREMGAFEAAEFAWVVDDSLAENEVRLDAQLDQFPRPLRELGQLVPQARLSARRESSHWVAALGFPETPSLDGLATPGVGLASRTTSSDEERTCVARMMVDAMAGLRALGGVVESERSAIIQRIVVPDAQQCGNGELATSEREAVQAALSVLDAFQ